MYFKNAIIYQVTQPINDYIVKLEENIDTAPFKSCAPSQASSIGFVPVCEDGPLLLDQQHVAMIRVRHQERKVPAGGVREMVDERCKAIEEDQERKVYRKERQTIADEITQQFLPKAIPESKWTAAYFDRRLNMIIVDASTPGKAEIVISLIREVIGTFPVLIPQTTESPATHMTQWVREQDAGVFTLGMSCELREPCEHGPVHRIKDEDLQQESIQAAIEEGKQVVSLAVDWEDKMRFTISEAHIIKQIAFDIDQADAAENEEELARVDADIAIMTSYMHELVQVIGAAFGGWFEQEHLDLGSGSNGG